jgi:hypothetical protein
VKKVKIFTMPILMEVLHDFFQNLRGSTLIRIRNSAWGWRDMNPVAQFHCFGKRLILQNIYNNSLLIYIKAQGFLLKSQCQYRL